MRTKNIFSIALLSIMLVSGCNSEPPVHEHTWLSPTYSWNDDHSSCTATRICEQDNTHVETETQSSTYEVVTNPGCETNGLGRYTVIFDNSAFSKQTHDVSLSATNHSWGSPSYSWEDDYSSCTATRVCANDASHTESETVTPTYKVITDSTTEETGTGRYTATFTNTVFTEQTHDVSIPVKAYHGETPKFNLEQGTVTYGLYPQTYVSDEELLTELNKFTYKDVESNGWYKYNDDYYAKRWGTPEDSRCKFDDGTTVKEHVYYWFKCEPIEWKILSTNNDEYLLVSSVLLDTEPYHVNSQNRTIDGATIYPNNYEYSYIRAWLNGYDGSSYSADDHTGYGFVDTAFCLNSEYLKTVEVDNSASSTNSESNPNFSNNTNDKVFLLSYKDYTNSDYGFMTSSGADMNRRSRVTDYAKASGAYYDITNGYRGASGYYWTRTPTSTSSTNPQSVYEILTNGGFGTEEVWSININEICVRPAIVLKISNQ